MTLENLQIKISFIEFSIVVLVWQVIFFTPVSGEKMPLKHFTIADGLPQNSINSINQDTKGFFWIGTNGGLARFDGYGFVNFTQQQGLPRNEILDFLETREGDFWLATAGGLVKFTPDGKTYDHVVTSEEAAQLAEPPLFTTYKLPALKISKLHQDSRGTIWIGTANGLFQLRKKDDGEYSFSPVDINLPTSESKYIYALYEDRAGAIWIGTENNLTRISTDNRISTYRNNGEPIYFRALLEDHFGNLWVGTAAKGLFKFTIDENQTPQIAIQFAPQPDSEIEWIDKISEAADGSLWIAGMNGLYEFAPAANKLSRYTRTSGILPYRFQSMFEDRDGNVWLGTLTNGLYRLSTQGLVSYGTEDRLSFVRSVRLDNENNLILTAFVTNTELDEQGAKVERDIAGKVTPPFMWRLGKLTGDKFSWTIPNFSEPIENYGSGENQLSLQARDGEWWIVTGKGLFRFPKIKFEDLKTTVPLNVLSEKNGLTPESVFRLFEDSHGNLWIATRATADNGFYQWERATGTLRDMKNTPGFSEIKFNLISSFAEDSGGNIWLGFNNQGFARIRSGRIEFWGNEQKIPPGGVASLFFDRENRLWIATRQGGILRIGNPQAATPSIVNYTQDDGLSGNRTLAITQDRQGFIYIGTDRDINRFNPQTLEFKSLKLAAGEPQREYRSAICDREGTLWFGTTEGLVKYTPLPDAPPAPPAILITGVSVESEPQKVSAMGTTEINLPALAPQQNQVRIDFVSLSNLENENILYQYKINEDENWSPPNKERFVNFANLSAGKYQIAVRAVASGGKFGAENVSAKPALISFQILKPFYLRDWFVLLLCLAAAGIIYAFYRSRLEKLLEIERARTLIATDLHDDIGSNLSKISVLSEVVRMQLSDKSEAHQRLLISIAEVSRESVAAMRDIVWAINPKRDSVLEMIRKMREYAEEIFVPKGVTVKFSAPPQSAKIKLRMDLRRDLYLIFKEAVNNAARHSNCDSISIKLQAENREIVLEIKDDGGGFDAARETGGNGLSNIRTRVGRLKGKLKIASQIDSGTIIEIRVPQN